MLVFLRVLMLVFGLFEVINNIKYLKVEDGIKLGYNQHFEIPSSVSMSVMKKKIITMLVVGIIFLTCFSMTFIFVDYVREIVLATYIVYTVFAWGETLYYRTHLKAYVLASALTILVVLAFFLA